MIYDAKTLLSYLDTQEIPYLSHTHPALNTIEEARIHRGEDVVGFAKNLFLQDRDQNFYLLTCGYHKRIDLKKVRKFLGCRRLSFVTTDTLLQTLHVTPGSVSPLALIHMQHQGVRFLIDQDLSLFTYNYFHPLDNRITLSIQADFWVPLVEYWGVQVEWTHFSYFEPDNEDRAE